MTRRRRKRERKQASRDLRKLLAFAEEYDPMRKARNGLKQTFRLMGWDVTPNVEVADGVVIDFALERKRLAYVVMPAEAYVDAPDGGEGGRRHAPEAAARLAEIEARGWHVVEIAQQEWAAACVGKGGRGRGSAHVKRRDLVVERSLSVLPARVYE